MVFPALRAPFISIIWGSNSHGSIFFSRSRATVLMVWKKLHDYELNSRKKVQKWILAFFQTLNSPEADGQLN